MPRWSSWMWGVGCCCPGSRWMRRTRLGFAAGDGGTCVGQVDVCGDGGVGQEDSSFSEEKEAKRLLHVGPRKALTASHAAKSQKFFASFFQKRSASSPNAPPPARPFGKFGNSSPKGATTAAATPNAINKSRLRHYPRLRRHTLSDRRPVGRKSIPVIRRHVLHQPRLVELLAINQQRGRVADADRSTQITHQIGHGRRVNRSARAARPQGSPMRSE